MADEKPKDRPPTSRLGRLARLAGLAPRAIPFAIEGAKRALGGARTEDEERGGAPADGRRGEEDRRGHAQDARRDEGAAAQVRADGELHRRPRAARLRGALPARAEEAPRQGAAALARGRRAAGRRPSSAPPRRRSSPRWEREPFAAASIGQVHRALTQDGHDVAVKVQYPGIDKAIENDLKSVTPARADGLAHLQEAQRPADARRVPHRVHERARLRARGRDGRRLPPHQRRRSRGLHPARPPLAHHAAGAHARVRRGA